jgi:hypothetical protein
MKLRFDIDEICKYVGIKFYTHINMYPDLKLTTWAKSKLLETDL